jgi:hypothetical protein
MINIWLNIWLMIIYDIYDWIIYDWIYDNNMNEYYIKIWYIWLIE